MGDKSISLNLNELVIKKNTFKAYNRCYASNVNLIKTEPCYQLGSYEYCWTLNEQTLIEPFQELSSPSLPCQFNFTSYCL